MNEKIENKYGSIITKQIRHNLLSILNKIGYKQIIVIDTNSILTTKELDLESSKILEKEIE